MGKGTCVRLPELAPNPPPHASDVPGDLALRGWFLVVSRLLRAFRQWTLIVALAVSVGGHWALLQTAAWVGMLASFSRSMPLDQALSYTLDGKHPCRLCLAIESGRQSEGKADNTLPAPKGPENLLMILEASAESWLQGFPHEAPVRRERALVSRADSPPIPPPRRS